ncbi:hypothetical protein vseg_018336 [Gypsophila vaccaria]
MVCVSSPTVSLAINGTSFGFFKGQRGLRQVNSMPPLFFVICVDYLTRILNVVQEKHGFRFHPLYNRIKLFHSCFEDNFLLFCRGDVESITLLLRGFLTFSRASGLGMNNNKSNIYMNGLNPALKRTYLSRASMIEGTLPFKYSGIPISTRRLSIKECYILMERIVDRIRGLGARKLSYA